MTTISRLLFVWKQKNVVSTNSRLSRGTTARGSCSGLSLGGPTKVKARNSFLFTEGSLKAENKEHLIDFVVTLYFISLCSNALRSSKVSLTIFTKVFLTSCLFISN